MPIEDKIKLIKKQKDNCIGLSNSYKKRYKKTKFKDDCIDVIGGILSASSTSMTIAGITFPPILIGAVVSGGLSFVITQTQRQINLKNRYNKYATTAIQYEQIAREISVVLRKNHMTNKEYEDFLEDINSRLDLIDDTRIL